MIHTNQQSPQMEAERTKERECVCVCVCGAYVLCMWLDPSQILSGQDYYKNKLSGASLTNKDAPFTQVTRVIPFSEEYLPIVKEGRGVVYFDSFLEGFQGKYVARNAQLHRTITHSQSFNCL